MRTAVAAAALAGAAIGLSLPIDRPALAARRLGEIPRTSRRVGAVAIAAALIGLAALFGSADRRTAVLAVLALSVAGLGRRLLTSHRGRCAAAVRRASIVDLCDMLSAELRAGMPPETALRNVASGRPELGPAVSAARLGGDVTAALLIASRAPGGEALRSVAAGWQVAARTGASLASVLDRVAAGIRDDDAARQEVEASLGAPRATARLLALLPIGGLALGSSIGADPLSFLLETSGGLICLTAGVTLALLGLVWVDQLVTAATR